MNSFLNRKGGCRDVSIKKSGSPALFRFSPPFYSRIHSAIQCRSKHTRRFEKPCMQFTVRQQAAIKKHRCKPVFFFDYYNYNTLDKKSCSLVLRGLEKNSCGGASSNTWPWSINKMRVATSLAKPISCVTTIMVMPSSASCFIT